MPMQKLISWSELIISKLEVFPSYAKFIFIEADDLMVILSEMRH